MEDDPQPRLAILGAGPIGLEAALYARYLGYPVEIFEKSSIPAPSLFHQRDKLLHGTFADWASPLGVAALKVQSVDWQPPDALAILSGAELQALYFKLLAESDLIAEGLHLQSEVVDITRRDEEDDASFLIRCRDSAGAESIHEVDIVIDATGEAGNQNWFPQADSDGELSFLNPDADVYILGSKSHPGQPFIFRNGLAQIRELFAILGERDDLDVYATMPPLA